MEDKGSDSAKVLGHYGGSGQGLSQLGTGLHTHQAPPWGRAHGRAGPGGACSRAVCREGETGPAVALLVQGLMAPGTKMGSWAIGKLALALGEEGQSLDWQWV